jgi:putative NADH-flavin reductase
MKRRAEQTPSLDLMGDIIAAHVSAERFQQNLVAFRDVLSEIKKLRQLDLTEVHPAIIFDPGAAYRES